MADYQLWSWGYNHVGQLGNNSTVDVSTPVSVHSSGSFVQVSGYESTALALDDSG